MTPLVDQLNNVNEAKKLDLLEQNILDVDRINAPDSKKLQANILQLTQELPQYTSVKQAVKVYDGDKFLNNVSLSAFGLIVRDLKNGFNNNYKAVAASFVAVLMLLSLFLITPLSSTQESQLANDDSMEINKVTELSAEQLAAELEWQSLMLLQDEYAFAGL